MERSTDQQACPGDAEQQHGEMALKPGLFGVARGLHSLIVRQIDVVRPGTNVPVDSGSRTLFPFSGDRSQGLRSQTKVVGAGARKRGSIRLKSPQRRR